MRNLPAALYTAIAYLILIAIVLYATGWDSWRTTSI
jgi:hypothetical protein